MMPPPEAVAVISDLHLSLGDGWKLESFKSDTQMSALMEILDKRFAGKRLDLVILGDFFDLWQTVPASDLTATADSNINLTLDIMVYQQDLNLIADHHQEFFKALGLFSQRQENRLVIVPGNHDHAFVHDDLQAALKAILVRRFQFHESGDNLFFPEQYFYSSPELGVYMEHGNQYDKFNSYGDFGHFGPDPGQDECQGYGLVRLFWNRLKNLDPDIDNSPEHWGEWFNWLRRHGNWHTLVSAWDWWQDYQRDWRVDPIGISGYMKESALSVTSADGVERLTTPDILLNGEDKNPQMVFSNDPVVEGAYRKLYQDDKAFRQATDDILLKKFPAGPVPDIATLPPVGDVPHLDLNGEAKPIYPAAGGAALSLIYGEPLMRNLQGMFTPGQGPDLYRDAQGRRTYLDSRIYQMVIMGHTHNPKWEKIPGYSEKIYANTGTWTTKATNGSVKTERTVVVVEKCSDQGIWAEAGVITDPGSYQIVNAPELLPKSAC
jgi:UDP-2,3-diacylglucosamine pyrophosphatase LpxH